MATHEWQGHPLTAIVALVALVVALVWDSLAAAVVLGVVTVDAELDRRWWYTHGPGRKDG